MYNTAPFINLGVSLDRLLTEYPPEFTAVMDAAGRENPWFTRENIVMALRAIKERMLSPALIDRWLARYPQGPAAAPRNVGVVMAGNIPLAGFFDLMCVVVAGHNCFIKPSSKDDVLIRYLFPEIEQLKEDTRLDAVIATGSDNTNRYFRTAYRSVPALLRASRSSAAVLSGTESDRELELLGDDIFSYFGMGCRNVSRIFIPEGFDISRLTYALAGRKITFPKYLNIYRQQKAMLAMRGEKFIDGGFFTLRESDGDPQALSDILYSRYSSIAEAEAWLAANDDKLQCVVSHAVDHPRRTDFGKAQHPDLWDYPDSKDIMKFLLNL